MTVEHAQAFATAMQELENTGDVEGFVSDVFAADADLVRPETDQHENGVAGATAFWQQYVDQFEQIHSEFSRVAGDDVGVLEWTSTGTLRNGADIGYRGASVLDFDGDGRVTRFATYYDTAAFTAPKPAPAGGA